METSHPHYRLFLGSAFVLIVIAGSALYLYFRPVSLQTLQQTSPWAVYDAVRKNNTDYAAGETLLSQNKFSEAEGKFVSALANVHSSAEEAEVKYKVAQSIASSGDYLRAITSYKEIAENTFYPRIVRSYAIQNMGLLFSRYGDPKITDAIFATEPYKSARAPGNDSLSFRVLYEYSATLYPLAMAELMIADWYSKEILSAADSGTPLSADTQKKYKDIIRERLALAEKDITRVTDSPEAVSMPATLARKAQIIARLQILGDTSFGDAEVVFKQSLGLAAVTHTQQQDGFTRYFYAMFLVRMANRSGDVPTILAPLYTDPIYKGTAAERFFKNEKDNATHLKTNVVRLANADPKFAAYLKTLGWTSVDLQ